MGSTGDSCRYGSAKYFALCALAGTLPCSLTHTALTPLDLIKCRMQVNPNKYRSVVRTLFHTIREDGLRGLVRGWAPTAIGYSLQGLTKFGLYEVFLTDCPHHYLRLIKEYIISLTLPTPILGPREPEPMKL